MENVIALQNPWKQGRKALVQSIIERKLVPKIDSWMDEEELIVIKGARQAGKTTILYCLIDQLLQKGVPPNHIFYFLLDNLTLRQYFSKDSYALKATLDQFIGQPLEDYDKRVYIF